MAHSEAVKAAFSGPLMNPGGRYEGQAHLSTVDARKALLLCAIVVAEKLDFAINDTGSRGNQFKYFTTVECLGARVLVLHVGVVIPCSCVLHASAIVTMHFSSHRHQKTHVHAAQCVRKPSGRAY